MSLPRLALGPDWFIIDKPSGLACHRSKMVRDRDTVVSRLAASLDQRIHLVHRLDRATSGCLLVALNRERAASLQAAMTSAEARKVYLVLVRGFFKWDDPVRVTTPMTNSKGQLREADTTLEVLGRSQHPRASLLLARPATGRYHQVRRHARDLDHPVLLDRNHGDHRENATWKQLGLHRLGLHCVGMALAAPHAEVTAMSPIPDDLRTGLEATPWWSEVEPTLEARVREALTASPCAPPAST